jgi:hypothetical protein
LFTYLWLACRFLRSAVRLRSDVALENLTLRQQLVVLTRSSRRPRLTRADRLFWSWLSRAWPRWRSALVIVQPDTVVRWHRARPEKGPRSDSAPGQGEPERQFSQSAFQIRMRFLAPTGRASAFAASGCPPAMPACGPLLSLSALDKGFGGAILAAKPVSSGY